MIVTNDAAEWAWLAGLFEGEGCIYFRSKNGVTLSVEMTDEDIIHRIYDIAKVGTIQTRKATDAKHKASWVWSVSGRHGVRLVLGHISQYFGKRRSISSAEALARLDRMRPFGVCKRGHILEGPNLRMRADNGRFNCVACQRARDLSRDYRRERYSDREAITHG
jgi:hypothetical protein